MDTQITTAARRLAREVNAATANQTVRVDVDGTAVTVSPSQWTWGKTHLTQRAAQDIIDATAAADASGAAHASTAWQAAYSDHLATLEMTRA